MSEREPPVIKHGPDTVTSNQDLREAIGAMRDCVDRIDSLARKRKPSALEFFDTLADLERWITLSLVYTGALVDREALALLSRQRARGPLTAKALNEAMSAAEQRG